ncbi:MAG: ABC transporter permease [Thermoplasmatales archaeon]
MIESPASKETKKISSKGKSGTFFYFRLIFKDKSGFIGLIIVSLFFGWSLIEGVLQFYASVTNHPGIGIILLPHNPFKLNLLASEMPPSYFYLLGTDANGEDILSRILYALPRDALISLIVVISAIAIGSVLGIVSGYMGKMTDEVIMRVTDAFLAVPALILVIAISVVLGGSYAGAVIGLLVVWWPVYARLFRAQTLKIKNLDFMQATKLNNVSIFKLFFRYLFLNDTDPIIAYAALDFGQVILTYSVLAFLGIGLTPPIPELGSMSANGVAALPTAWWWAIFPGFAILILVIGFVLLGDRLQDIISNRINY